MPPKGNAGGGFLAQAEEDKVLQAVVIADSFNERFMPITIDKPRVRNECRVCLRLMRSV